MNENPPDALGRTLRQRDTRYVVGIEGHSVAVILTLEEYYHYLSLLDDDADSQNDKLAARLIHAATQSAREQGQPLQDRLHQREAPGFSSLKTPLDG